MEMYSYYTKQLLSINTPKCYFLFHLRRDNNWRQLIHICHDSCTGNNRFLTPQDISNGSCCQAPVENVSDGFQIKTVVKMYKLPHVVLNINFLQFFICWSLFGLTNQVPLFPPAFHHPRINKIPNLNSDASEDRGKCKLDDATAIYRILGTYQPCT